MADQQQSPEDVKAQQDYSKLCAQAGDLQVKINELHAALQQVHANIGKLKEEYAASKAPKAEASDAPVKA